LPNTAPKATFNRAPEIVPSKLTAIDSLVSNSNFDIGNIDSILNRVRPGIHLNRVQSSVKDCIFYSNESAVLGAPTGKFVDIQC